MVNEMDDVSLLLDKVFKKISVARKKVFLEGYISGYRRIFSGNEYLEVFKNEVIAKALTANCGEVVDDPDSCNYSDFGLRLGAFSALISQRPGFFFALFGAEGGNTSTSYANAFAAIVRVTDGDKNKILYKRIERGVNKLTKEELTTASVKKGIMVVLGLLKQ